MSITSPQSIYYHAVYVAAYGVYYKTHYSMRQDTPLNWTLWYKFSNPTMQSYEEVALVGISEIELLVPWFTKTFAISENEFIVDPVIVHDVLAYYKIRLKFNSYEDEAVFIMKSLAND